ncbi:UrcA family protein [Phenylobacterium sp.]|uniref:UrcA family protein n=1 Tax=Phenylobacterium sp. TaxID=1871053 RepID=UPI0035615C36
MKTLAFALAVVCLGAGFASAHPPVRTPEGEGAAPVLRYADLNLRREPGVRMLVGRIKQAAHAFCGPEPSALSLGEYQRYGACVRESTDAAVRRVNAPLVTSIYKQGADSLRFAAR